MKNNTGRLYRSLDNKLVSDNVLILVVVGLEIMEVEVLMGEHQYIPPRLNIA